VRKHGNHLRLIEHAMTAGLPGKVADAAGLREVYELLLGLPSLGPFLACQYAVDLAYSAVTRADESQFVVAGPGALDGISKCFAGTGGLPAAEVIAWMRDTSRGHLERLGLEFTDLWGRWPTLIDWQNVFCEVSKYTRATHPHVRGVSGRTRIKQEFRQTRRGSTTGSRRGGGCRQSGRPRSARRRAGEGQGFLPQVVGEDAAAAGPYGAQAAQARRDGVRPLAGRLAGYFQGVSHLLDGPQEARLWRAARVPVAGAGVAEHCPCDGLVGDGCPAAVLDMVGARIRAPFDSRQPAEDG
jgi:hypothetical protein